MRYKDKFNFTNRDNNKQDQEQTLGDLNSLSIY